MPANPTDVVPPVRILFVGTDGKIVVNSAETRAQIDAIRRLRCELVSPDDAHEPIAWDDLDNPQEPRTLFQFILGDRRVRVDQKTLMADRPPVVVVTEHDGAAIRLEMYEGHDQLECTYDLRSMALQGRDLPRWMEHDPHGYDPVAFLRDALGIPAETAVPLLQTTHDPETPGLAPSYRKGD